MEYSSRYTQNEKGTGSRENNHKEDMKYKVGIPHFIKTEKKKKFQPRCNQQDNILNAKKYA